MIASDVSPCAERLFRKPCSFARSVHRLADLPEDGRPEVCFWGRSNCGKSSLLNALVGRRSLAHTSSAPGRTRSLNYFDLAGRLWLVDLPGYGYARASAREASAWDRLVQAYLGFRRNLSRVYVLVDARRGVGAADHGFLSLLDQAGLSHLLVVTKTDKIRPSERGATDESLMAGIARHPAALQTFLRSSAKARIGLAELRADIVKATGTTE